MTSARRVLVVVAHPDDEVLACGASIAKWCSLGAEVGVLFMADGVSSRREEVSSSDRCRRRREESAKSARCLGHQILGFHDYPDNKMDTVPLLDVVRDVEAVLNDFGPDVVVTHYVGDLNIDHQVVARSVQTAARPVPRSPIRTLLAGEVPSSTEWGVVGASFDPDTFVDVSGFLDKKLEALAAYASEVRAAPHPRSLLAVEALARWRGSIGGCNVAESFSVIRQFV